MIIKLEPNALTNTTTSVDKPVLFINKIVFVTNDINWVNRLAGSSLKMTFTCIDKDNKPRKSSGGHLSFGAFITPYHRQPVMEVNQLFSFTEKFHLTDGSECKQWETILELNNLTLVEGERIEIITDYYKPSTIEEIINEIERGKKMFGDLNLSTQALLKLIPHYRLDWSQDDNEFSDEFNIGATKPILLSGLANQTHKLKSNSLLFKDSIIAKLLVDTFLVEKKLTINLLKEIHRHIIKDGGQFRNQNVVVSDRQQTVNTSFPDASEIYSELESLINWYNTEMANTKLHPLFISSIFHYNLVKIHPFLDGNGRLARVITSLILLSFNIPPPISELENRVEYLNALRSGDKGDIKPLIFFIGNRIIQSMNYALILKHNSDG